MAALALPEYVRDSRQMALEQTVPRPSRRAFFPTRTYDIDCGSRLSRPTPALTSSSGAQLPEVDGALPWVRCGLLSEMAKRVAEARLSLMAPVLAPRRYPRAV